MLAIVSHFETRKYALQNSQWCNARILFLFHSEYTRGHALKPKTIFRFKRTRLLTDLQQKCTCKVAINVYVFSNATVLKRVELCNILNIEGSLFVADKQVR